jgi:LmbE family N-acetylglucosaminyl deacetylase
MRFTYFMITILLSASLFALILYDKEPETSIFYSPHADDEILSLGPSILSQIEKGHEVAVVLLSHGEASQSFVETNKTLNEKGMAALTRSEFGDSRVNEFENSVEAMGVHSSHVHVYDLPDGQFDKEDIKEVMKEMNELYPNARHHALSYRDPHHDHAVSGEALKELENEGVVDSALYYLPVQEFKNMDYDGVYTVPLERTAQYKNSVNSYNIWEPQRDFYRIGYTSVKSYFNAAMEFKESRWHK